MNSIKTTLIAIISTMFATFSALALEQEHLEWETPKIEGYAQFTESDFPEYFEAVNNRPGIRLIAAYLPSNEGGKPDFGIHEKTGRQIIISRFPLAISSEQFPQLKKQVFDSVGLIQKGMIIDLGGVQAKVEDLVPPNEDGNTSFSTGMLIAIEGPDGSTVYQASAMMLFWINERVIRIEHQEFITTLDSWFADLNKRNLEVRKSFTDQNTTKPN